MSGVEGDRIVALVRLWIGTPYRHQASTRGAGSDCLGLLRGLWRECYGAEPEAVPAYTPDWSEPGGEEVLLAAAERWLVRRRDGAEGPGDVLLFRLRMGSVAKHLGIAARCGAMPTFIHAYSGHGVVENSFSDPWRRRVVARFAFPRGVS